METAIATNAHDATKQVEANSTAIIDPAKFAELQSKVDQHEATLSSQLKKNENEENDAEKQEEGRKIESRLS